MVKVSYQEEPAKYTLDANAGAAVTPKSPQTSADTTTGDFANAFAASPIKLDVTYTTPLQSHVMMEPHATIASWDGDSLTVYTANQMLNRGQKAIAKTLGMPAEKVRLVSRYIGGGFGGKLWVMADCMLAALGSKAIGRPVKVVLTRQQVFHVTTHRSDTIQRVRIGTDAQGVIQAISHDSLSGNLESQASDFEGCG